MYLGEHCGPWAIVLCFVRIGFHFVLVTFVDFSFDCGNPWTFLAGSNIPIREIVKRDMMV